jgi:signal transduction histidine kinase
VHLELSAEDELPAVAADAGQLSQVISNLIENAIKYSPEGGTIEVEVESGDRHVLFAISDPGLGIPPREQQRIFQKFYRLDPHMSRGIGGTGLGLYICRELVRRMDGRMTVSSKEGEGSTFVVELPLAAAPAAEPDAPVVQHA